MSFKPLLAVLELTNACNLNCIHCSAGRKKDQESVLSFVSWKLIIDKLVKSGCETVSLSGGEPLMNPDFFEILKHCKQAGLEVALTSNGYFISKKVANKLAGYGVDQVQISLDGLKKVHERIRGAGSFARALSAIENLLSANVTTSTMTILSKLNNKDLGQFIKMASSLGVDHMGFERLTPVGNGARLKDLVLPPRMLKECFTLLYELRQKYRIELNDPLRVLLDKDLKRFSVIKNFPCGGCFAGIFTCVIGANGDLKLCTRLPHRLGNLRKQEIKEIWTGPIITKLRKRILKGKCNRCRYKSVCGGCRAEALSNSGGLFDSDPGCWYHCSSHKIASR